MQNAVIIKQLTIKLRVCQSDRTQSHATNKRLYAETKQFTLQIQKLLSTVEMNANAREELFSEVCVVCVHRMVLLSCNGY